MLSIFYHFFFRFVSKRNKTHDRVIALWNARMRIYFDANSWELGVQSRHGLHLLVRLREVMFTFAIVYLTRFFERSKDSCIKNRLGCRKLWRHSQLQTWWTHNFSFFAFRNFLSISFLLAPHALPCGKPLDPFICLQRNYFSSLSPSTCVGAQQNAWPVNRFVKCADAYIFRRKML